MDSNIMTGTTAPAPPPRREYVHRCSECCEELFLADRGFGSTAWACPNHDFERMILTIPKDVEDDVKHHPVFARRYVEYITGE